MQRSPDHDFPSSIDRIAVVRALHLGDLLCAVPAFQALRQIFPNAEITLIGLPWAQELVRRLPYIDRLLLFPGYPGIGEVPYTPARTDTFLAQQRTCGYDLALQMHGDGRAMNGFVAGLGARTTLGYRRGTDQRLSISLPYLDGEHELLRWLRLVQAMGAGSVAPITRPEFPTTRAEQQRASGLLAAAPARTGPLVGLHAGAKDPARRWPAACFAALADRLIAEHDARIVLTGSAAERGITAAVRRRMRHPALDLAGATDLGTFAALIACLDLLVTNDTGASHLAAASATPSVVLFGPSRPAQWAPLDGQRHGCVDALALPGPARTPDTALRHLPVGVVLEACEARLLYVGRLCLS